MNEVLKTKRRVISNKEKIIKTVNKVAVKKIPPNKIDIYVSKGEKYRKLNFLEAIITLKIDFLLYHLLMVSVYINFDCSLLYLVFSLFGLVIG